MEKHVPTKTIWETVGSWFPALRVRFCGFWTDFPSGRFNYADTLAVETKRSSHIIVYSKQNTVHT
jgi:hypothetical protein